MNKKGFTLIELLAVIVILAIIALIATPIVLNIIDETKSNATLRSADFYLDAVELSVAEATLENKNLESKTYDIMSDGNICLETLTAGKCIGTGNRENNEEDILKVEINGEAPTSGTITIDGGTISSIKLNYKDGKTIVKNSDGDLIYKETPTLSSLCELKDGEAKTIGAKYECDFGDGKRNFYILELGSNKVDESTLKYDEVALILEGNYDTTTQSWCASTSDNSCNADGLTSKLNDIATAWKELDAEQIVLPSAVQVATADGKVYTDNTKISSTNAWLSNWPDNVDYALGETAPYGYWTSTGNSRSAWFVNCYSRVSFTLNLVSNDSYGVRPVVNLKI